MSTASTVPATPTQFSTVVYDNASPGPASPAILPAGYVWNVLDRLIYSSNNPNPDNGQHVAHYIQTVKYGAASAKLWGACIEIRDATSQPSAIGGVMQALEIDLAGNGPDNLTTEIGRSAVPIVLWQHNTAGLPFEIGRGVNVCGAGGHVTSVRRAYAVGNTQVTEAAFDAHESNFGPGARVLWGHDNAPIALSTDGNATIRWDSSTQRFKLAYAGADLFSIDRVGNIRTKGAVLTYNTP